MSYRVYCNQCNALAINGMACHESGCPHEDKPWVTRTRGFVYPVMFPEGKEPDHLRKEKKVHITKKEATT